MLWGALAGAVAVALSVVLYLDWLTLFNAGFGAPVDYLVYGVGLPFLGPEVLGPGGLSILAAWLYFLGVFVFGLCLGAHFVGSDDAAGRMARG